MKGKVKSGFFNGFEGDALRGHRIVILDENDNVLFSPDTGDFDKGENGTVSGQSYVEACRDRLKAFETGSHRHVSERLSYLCSQSPFLGYRQSLMPLFAQQLGLDMKQFNCTPTNATFETQIKPLHNGHVLVRFKIAFNEYSLLLPDTQSRFSVVQDGVIHSEVTYNPKKMQKPLNYGSIKASFQPVTGINIDQMK